MSTTSHHPSDDSRCPCGTGDLFGACCGPILRGDRRAPTAEALMRSRFTAFATRDLDHALRSWHPDTRPARPDLAATLNEETRWLRLDVRASNGGGPFDDEGTVEFVAIAKTDKGRRELHEISHFIRQDGAWHYVRGDLPGTRRHR